MAEVIGQAACPECSELQDVYFDTRKYYLKCTSCHTFTTYQSNAAKKRFVENRLILPPAPEEEVPEPEPPAVEDDNEILTQPAQETELPDMPPVEQVKRGFFDSYADFYSLENDND